MLRAEPEPSSPSSATTTTGRWWRSTIREATIPTTPGCHPSPASTYENRSPLADCSATCASASHTIRCSTARRSVLTRSSSDAISAARRSSAVSSSSRPASARRSRPAALIRGASRKPERARVERARIGLRDGHQRAQARSRRTRQRQQALAHEPAVLADERHQVGDRRERDQLDVVLDAGRAERLRELVGDRGSAQVGARVPAHGGMDDLAVGQPPVRPRRVVVADDDVEPGRARGRDLVDRGDRAVDRDQQRRCRARRGGARCRAPGRSRRSAGRAGTSRRPPRAREARGPSSRWRTRRRRRSRRARRSGCRPRMWRSITATARSIPANALGSWASVGSQERARGAHVGQPAADEHLRQHVADAELALERERGRAGRTAGSRAPAPAGPGPERARSATSERANPRRDDLGEGPLLPRAWRQRMSRPRRNRAITAGTVPKSLRGVAELERSRGVAGAVAAGRRPVRPSRARCPCALAPDALEPDRREADQRARESPRAP